MKDQKLYIQAGGGVVYDSDPEAEYMETVHKSNAIRRAAATRPASPAMATAKQLVHLCS